MKPSPWEHRYQWFSKCGPWTNSINVVQELVRNAVSWTPSRSAESEPSVFQQSVSDSDAPNQNWDLDLGTKLNTGWKGLGNREIVTEGTGGICL